MDKLSYRRHRFPSIVIQQAVWLYFRFALSYRDVEDMLAERGIDVSYETVRRWALKFGGIIARKLRRDDGPRNEISVACVPVPLNQRRVNEQLESGQA